MYQRAILEEKFMLNVTKVNEIRNLNLIYVYSTNSIFDKDNNKYVGIKIVYNNASILIILSINKLTKLDVV